MNKDLQDKLSTLESMIGIQRNCLTYQGSIMDYMHGMLNGLIAAHSVFAEQNPQYHTVKRKRKGLNKIRHKSSRKGRK